MIYMGPKEKRKRLKGLSSRTTVLQHTSLTHGMREKLGSLGTSPFAAEKPAMAIPGKKTDPLAK